MHAESQAVAVNLDLADPAAATAAEPAIADDCTMDKAAFRILYEKSARPLFGYLLRVSGSRDPAEELFQETYCRFLAASRPRMDEGQQKSYLFRIATNLLRDKWKRGKIVATFEPPEAGSSHPDAEAQADMRRAFQQLKPRERQLLWLAYVEGSNHKEISDSTGLRPASIRILLFRARRKLAEMLRASKSDVKKVNL